MTFLNPLILFGLLSAAVPLIIHLLNLKKLKKIQFSSLAFLKEIQQTKIRRLKLKQLLLLIIRTLIVIFLVLAFARPTIKSISLPGSSAAKTTSVFILDNSFSMTKLSENGTILNEAKKTIKSIIQNAEEGDNFAIIPAVENNSDKISLLKSKEHALRKLNETEFSSVTGNYFKSISQAIKILQESQDFNKEIFLFTDFQKNNFKLTGNNPALPEHTGSELLYTINLASKAKNNAAVTQLISETAIFEKGKPLKFKTTIKNEGDNPQRNLVVSLFANGNRTSQKSIDLNPGEEKSVFLEAVSNKAGFINISAGVEDDELPQDNFRYLSVYIPEKIKTALICENEEDTKFLIPVLSNEIVKNTIDLEIFTGGGISSFNYDVIILCGSVNANAAISVKNYINNGGRMILMPSVISTPEKYAAFLNSLDINASVKAIGSFNYEENYSEFDEIDYSHPVFADIFDSGTNKIGSPEFYYYFDIKFKGNARSIISLLQKVPFLSEIKKGNAEVLVINSAPSLSWNNLPLKSVFAPLITRSVFYLSSGSTASSENTAGNPVPIDISRMKSTVLKVKIPGGGSEIVNTDSVYGRKYVSFSQTSVPGFYEVYDKDKLVYTFTVNPDSSESGSAFLTESGFESFCRKINFNGKVRNIRNKDNPAAEINETRFGTELWKLLIIIVMLLAAAEMFIAKSMKKDLNEIEIRNV